MRNKNTCPQCGPRRIIRVPDDPRRHASGNNIYTTRATLLGKIPVIRYVCRDRGYVESWVEERRELERLAERFG